MRGTICLILLAFPFYGIASGAQLRSDLSASFGRRLDRERPETALTLEPRLGVDFAKWGVLSLSSAIERPTDSHENFRVPRTPLIWELPVSPVSLIFTTNAVELHRWNLDGVMLRQSAAVEWAPTLFEGFRVPLRAGTFVQWNEYRLGANGRGLPRHGFFQRIGIEYLWKRLRIDLRISVEQRQAGVWKNDYGTYERVMIRVSDNFLAGLSHELLSNVIDETTGASRSLAVFDGRESKLSVVAQWAW